MTSIRDEIRKVETGEWEINNNPLHNAPHTLADITDTWVRGYTIKEAVFPVAAATNSGQPLTVLMMYTGSVIWFVHVLQLKVILTNFSISYLRGFYRGASD